jgi:hypothetical protein
LNIKRNTGDSKLLSGFPWPVGMEVKAVMNNPPNSSLWYEYI